MPDLRSAVAHYTSLSFRFSSAGVLMERFRIEMTGDEVDVVVAFLEALSVDPSPPLAPDVAIGVDPFAEGDPIHEK